MYFLRAKYVLKLLKHTYSHSLRCLLTSFSPQMQLSTGTHPAH